MDSEVKTTYWDSVIHRKIEWIHLMYRGQPGDELKICLGGGWVALDADDLTSKKRDYKQTKDIPFLTLNTQFSQFMLEFGQNAREIIP